MTERTAYRPYEIIVVDNQSTDPATLAYLGKLETTGAARLLRFDGPFNFSAINNFAARAAAGELIALVNNDVEVIEPGWLNDMAALAMRTGVGAVGAKLLYADETIQHAGIVLGIGGVAGHPHKGYPASSLGYFARLQLLQNYSAVTAACLVVRKDRYWEVGGLDESEFAVAFNDVDLCLKLRQRGYRNVWTPTAVLLHHESASRGKEDDPRKRKRFAAEHLRMRRKWGSSVLLSDPCYNPNLTLDKEDFLLAWPPRAPSPCGARLKT